MDEDVEDLVASWLALRERGEAPDPGSFAASHPEHEAALLQALETLTETERLLPMRAGMPDRVGSWRILRLLGTGGSGVVFEARAVDDPARRAAVKILAPARAGDLRARSRLKREARVLMDDPHPNVVRVLEVDADAAIPWLAMELIEGVSLREILDRARPRDGGLPARTRLDLPGDGDPFARVARCGLGLAEALEWAHGRGLVHRDMKPGNVMLRVDGSPVLLDFGLAVDPDATALTRTGDVLGTPAYMAPEQARGERAGPEADIYGLGAILFEMATLRPPFQGSDTSEVLRKVRTSVSPRVRRLDRLVPAPLACVIETALAPRARWRQRSASVVAHDLRRFLEGRSVASRPPSAVARLLWCISARPLLAVGTLAVVLLVATAVLFFTRASDARRTALALARSTERAALQLAEPLGSQGLEGTAREIAALDPGSELAAILLDLAAGKPLRKSTDAGVGRLVEAERARLEGDARRSLAALEPALDDPGLSSIAWALAARNGRDAGIRKALLVRLAPICDSHPEGAALHAVFGHLLVLEARHAEASAAFARARAGAPEPGHLGFHEASALDRAGRRKEALEAARRGGHDVLVRFGRFLDREKRRPEAWGAFREVLAAQPDRIDARFHLATSLAAAEEVEEAVSAYREVLARDRAHAPALVSLAWIHAWVCGHERCASVRDPERALELATAAVRADGGRDRAILLTATRVARHLDRKDVMIGVIGELVADSRRAGRDVGLLEDALKELSAP
jgi:tetratricopeptide (TPR) repeat protein